MEESISRGAHEVDPFISAFVAAVYVQLLEGCKSLVRLHRYLAVIIGLSNLFYSCGSHDVGTDFDDGELEVEYGH